MIMTSKKKFYFLALATATVFFVFLAFYLVNKDPRTKVCSPVRGSAGSELRCELCSCPRGEPIAGIGGAACADGAQPTCEAVK